MASEKVPLRSNGCIHFSVANCITRDRQSRGPLGDGSPRNYLEEPKPEDPVGEPVTVCRVDWPAQGPEDYSYESSAETLEITEDVLRDVGF